MSIHTYSWRQRLLTVGLFLGVILGLVYSFGGLIIDLATIGLNWGTFLAFGALIGMPVVFALSGCILGLLIDLLLKIFIKKD